MLHVDSGAVSGPRIVAVSLVLAVAALGAVGTASAQNEDAYRPTIDAPDAVKVGEEFDVTLTIDIVDSPAQVTISTELRMLVDGEVRESQSFQLAVENGKSVSRTYSLTLDEPGTHEIGFEIDGQYVGTRVVGGNPESKPGLATTVTAVSNVSTSVGDVAPGSPANVTLERSTADVQLHRLELGSDAEVRDVFVEIQPSTEPPSGYGEGPADAERYFVVRPTNADASAFTTVRASVLVAEDAFLPGAEVGVYRGTGDGWEELSATESEVDGGTLYDVTMQGLDPIAVTATGGEEPEPDAGDGGDGDGGDDGGQGLPGFTAVLALVGLVAATVIAASRRRR